MLIFETFSFEFFKYIFNLLDNADQVCIIIPYDLLHETIFLIVLDNKASRLFLMDHIYYIFF